MAKHDKQIDPNAKQLVFQMRVSREWARRIDRWRIDQEDLPSRAEAIRRLVDAALDAEGAEKERAPAAASSK